MNSWLLHMMCHLRKTRVRSPLCSSCTHVRSPIHCGWKLILRIGRRQRERSQSYYPLLIVRIHVTGNIVDNYSVCRKQLPSKGYSSVFKGLLHCFSACTETTGNNWYCFNLKNVQKLQDKKFQRVKRF